MPRAALLGTGLMLVLAASLGGCPQLGLGGGAATSLAGTWKIEGPNGAALPVEVTLTISAANRITNIAVQPQGISLPPPLPVVAQVNGDAVTINTTFPMNLGSFQFEGTLNGAGDEISGSLTVNVNRPGVPATTTSAGTLVKQS